MKLTSYTNYALRCLQLAAIRAPNLVRTDDVVAIHGISRAHIVKVIHELGKAGYIQTVRGRNGGFKLNQPAHDIANNPAPGFVGCKMGGIWHQNLHRDRPDANKQRCG